MNDDMLELSMWRDGNIIHGNCLEDMAKLKAERDEARREVCEWATCKQLTKERDEARREVCECKVHQQHDPRQYAQDRGWYCYKSDNLSQEVSQERQ